MGRCVALAAIALATTGVGAAPTASSATASPLHVFVVVMENRSFTTVMSNPQFAALARRGDLATNYYAVAHPSLPNYLA
ncbi:MAG: hypothetical protein ACRDV0_00795, partial [Acidimicrobiales bacterium]